MTAKGKAIELVGKYCGNDYSIGNIKKQKVNALICVDEILKMPFENQSDRNYWQEVKNEINKL